MTNKHFPRVVFKTIPLADELEWIYGFLFYNQWGWEKRILKKHPALRAVYQRKTKQERFAFLRMYILQYRAQHKESFVHAVRQYQRDWHRVERRYFLALSRILGTPWPGNRRNITAFISIDPICPRFLDSWSFSLYYRQSRTTMLETIMHETCHFLYFKKWKEVFPNTIQNSFEYPHIIWHLSEILAPVILQDDRIKPLLHRKPHYYNEHARLRIEGSPAPQFFERLYRQYRKDHANTDIATFLREVHSVLLKHRSLFIGIQ